MVVAEVVVDQQGFEVWAEALDDHQVVVRRKLDLLVLVRLPERGPGVVAVKAGTELGRRQALHGCG